MAVNQLGHFNFPTFETFLHTVTAHLEASLKAQNYELQLNKEQQLTYRAAAGFLNPGGLAVMWWA